MIVTQLSLAEYFDLIVERATYGEYKRGNYGTYCKGNT